MSTLTGKIVADFRTSLATELAVGGTTATLQSATDDDGVSLPAGNYYFTVDGNNSQKEHFAVTLSGTSLTAIKSVSRQGVQTSGAVRKHRIGASVVITDFAHIQVINDLINGTTDLNASDPLKYDGTATISDDAHLATKKYVDDTAVAGAPDATTGVKGLVEIATGAELAAGTGTGGTGAAVVPAGSSFKNTSAGAGDANKVPVLDTAGVLDNTFMPTTLNRTADSLQISTDANSANDAVRSSYLDATLDGRITAAQATAVKSGPTSLASEYHYHLPTQFHLDATRAGSFDFTAVGDLTSRSFQATTSPDGSDLYTYVKVSAANANRYMDRYTRDATGNFYNTGTNVNTAVGNTGASQYAALACGTTYVWTAILNAGSTNIEITRYARDLSGVTTMTISGTANTTSLHRMCGNDSVLYVLASGSTTVAVYTISGTTATRGTDITLGDNATAVLGMWFDGTDIVYTTATAIKRYNVSGASQATRTININRTVSFGIGIGYRTTVDLFLFSIRPSPSVAAPLNAVLEGYALDKP